MSDLRTKAVPLPLSRPIAVRMPGAVKYKFFSILNDKKSKRVKKLKIKKILSKIMLKKLFGKLEEEKRRYNRNFKALAFAI